MRYLLLLLALPLLLGASGGPQVLDDLGQRRFARGPWVSSYESDEFDLVCNMTSDTCSDGRQITTTRATPVPCEISPGVWEMVGVDEGCYSVRGLESWAATTSYLAYGAELDRSPWGIQGDAEIMQIADGFRVCHTTSSVNSGIRQSHTIGLDETATLSVIARRNTASGLFLSPFSNGGGVITMSPAGWGAYSRTETRTGAATAFIYPRPGGVAQCVDLLAAWLTKTDTPGRPCWGGEAPVTCAADRHTISTEGWPTESGSISVAFKFEEFSESFSIILDARTSPSSGFNIHYDRSNGRLVHRQDSNLLLGPTVETGKPYFVELRRKGPRVEMLLNGVLVASDDDWPPWSYSPIAALGKHFLSGTGLYVKGSISSLRVRSTE